MFLVIDELPDAIIYKEIGKMWTMKKSSIGPPTIYLGNKVTKVTLENDVTCWSFSSSQYVQAVVINTEKYPKSKGKSLPKRATLPSMNDYRPEVDVMPELNISEATYYHFLIGVLCWIVELGNTDITCEVSEMAFMMTMSIEGHLDQLCHIFAYLKLKHNAEMVLEPPETDLDDSVFQAEDLTHTVNDNAMDEIAPDTPAPHDFGFKIRAFVDADNAGNLVTPCLRSGFVIFLNNVTIYWLSKQQTGIETRSFGCEFMAMKHNSEYLPSFHFKLWSTGIPVDCPCYVFGDNKSVLFNGSQPYSILKMKSNSIVYHFVRPT
jgi:hypothetical protein